MTQPQIDAKVAEVKAVFAERGFAFFEKGDYNLNIVGSRYDDFYDNGFTDRLVVIYRVNGVWQWLELDWTTMPGTFGGVYNPITVFGITGTAVLKEGQYRRAYQFVDSTNNIYGSPYFAQVLPVTVYRDGDRDNVFDRDMPQQTGLFAIFIHPMGDGDTVNNWSIGCQGTRKAQFNKLVEVTRKAVAIWGNIFSYTLIHRDWLQPTKKKREAPKEEKDHT